MNWLALVKLALTALVGFVTWLRERQLIEAGAEAAVSKGLKDAEAAIATAQAARDRIIADLNADPDGLRKPDKFQRPED